jgi:hypothetical protein
MPTYQELLDHRETHKLVKDVIHLVREGRLDPVDVCKDLELLSKAAEEESAATLRAAQSWFDSHVEVVGIGTTPDFADEFKQQLKQKMS